MKGETFADIMLLFVIFNKHMNKSNVEKLNTLLRQTSYALTEHVEIRVLDIERRYNYTIRFQHRMTI
jgi:hypothetical protein